MDFGPDGKLYLVIGELNRNEETSNHKNGIVNDIGAVLRMNPSGSAVTTNPFYSAKIPARKGAELHLRLRHSQQLWDRFRSDQQNALGDGERADDV